jgi:predicted DNA-binding mobile mystery protein A
VANSYDLSQVLQGTDRSRPIGRVIRPAAGWLRSVREALGLSLADQARKLKVTPPAVRSFEQAEAEDRITLASLRRTAAAMDCDLVYTLVPRSGALPVPVMPSHSKAVTTSAAQPAAPSTPPKPAAASATRSVVLDLTWNAEHGVD